MAGRKEPPVLITPAICRDPERLAKALQMNMDFLSQQTEAGVAEALATVETAVNAIPDEDDINAVSEEATAFTHPFDMREDVINTNETINNAAYTNLATTGPTVWFQCTKSRKAYIWTEASMISTGAAFTVFCSYNITHVTGDGSTTGGGEGEVLAAFDANAGQVSTTGYAKSGSANMITGSLGLTVGEWYKVKAEYRRTTGGGVCSVRDRKVICFPV